MITLREYIKEDMSAAPANTIGMGGLGCESGDFVCITAKPKKRKKKKKILKKEK